SGLAQRAFVADDYRQAARAQYFASSSQCHAECLGAAELAGSQLRVGAGQAVKQQQQALLAAPWLDLLMLVLAEDQPANTIVVAQGGPADQACSLCRKYRLEYQAAAEEQPWALFNEDINRAFALFVKQLGVRLLGACRNPPVDGAHIVASLIDAHLIAIHAEIGTATWR